MKHHVKYKSRYKKRRKRRNLPKSVKVKKRKFEKKIFTHPKLKRYRPDFFKRPFVLDKN